MIGINSIFRTIQGEGALLGVPMVFVRTSGCSVGCKGCDTNYSNKRRLTISEIVSECKALQTGGWIWITGGEPTDWCELQDLIDALKSSGFLVAVATSGVRTSPTCDFLSVSPHTLSNLIWTCPRGQQLNVVPGLNGMTIDTIAGFSQLDYEHKYVTPCDGKPETLTQCIDFILNSDGGWRLGIQAHKIWSVK